MTLRDLTVIAAGNLWRMKLRTTLTAAGVLIAITAFVAMLSFGAGNQELVESEFTKLGLFTTMQVYPMGGGGGRGRDNIRRPAADTVKHPVLDAAALERIAAIPGVNFVYPYDAMSVQVRCGDSTLHSKAQALPAVAMGTKLLARFSAGRAFASDSSREALISSDLARQLGISRPDSAIGLRLIVSVRVSTIDSAFSHVLNDQGVSLLDRARGIAIDSLFRAPYRDQVIRREGGELVRRFVRGFTEAQETVADTLTICGVREAGRRGRMGIEDVIVPLGTAARFSSRGVRGGPVEFLAAASNGTIFGETGGGDARSFTLVTLDYDPKVLSSTISDSVKAMGFRVFSFAEQFEEIQRMFIYFDLGLGVIGLIALCTASLGIANTMIMSINERRREIGVLKSLGADDADIRALFLVESAVIGLGGTVGGILSGWALTRIVSAIIQEFMRREGVPVMDLFALPWWLILISLSIGLTVSILAGYYPAARASRIDPVAALRNE